MAVLNCISDYIGISENNAVSESGLYVTDLEGVSIDNIGKISNKSDEFQAFKKAQKRAVGRFLNAFRLAMNECWKLRDEGRTAQLICENKELLSLSLLYFTGAELMRERTVSDRVNRFTSVYPDIDEIKNKAVYFDEVGSYELKEAVKMINPNDGAGEEVETNSIVTFIERTP